MAGAPLPSAAAPPPAKPGVQDFDQLLQGLMEDPEEILRADLSPEDLLELQRRLNPYACLAGPPRPDTDFKRIAAVSYTNLREDYLRRLAMTSLVGFIFQVFEEHEVPAARRRWLPRNAKKKGGAPCVAAELVQQLESALAIAQQAAAATKEAAELRSAAAVASLTREARVAALEARALATEAKAAGLLYTAAHAAHRVGADASSKLHATAVAGRAHPSVREVIDQYPLPSPPGQIEMPAAAAKEIVGGFLRDWLEFDPSVHVRSGHDAKKLAEAVTLARYGATDVPVDAKDPGHLTLAALLAEPPTGGAPGDTDLKLIETVEALTKTPRHTSAALCLLRETEFADAALTALADPHTYLQWLGPLARDSPARPAAEHVPPQDTFHRWNYYTEVNYEALRTVTEALYPERSDLDWAIALWAVFEGTAKEVDEAFDKHCQKYQDDTPSAIKALEFGGWSLLADFKQNRENIRFYNKHTEVIKRILDRHAEDKRIGGELMRQRVRANKAKNIAEAGPDAPGLNQYRRQVAEVGRDVGSRGAERVIAPSEMKRLEKARGDLKAAKELEVLEQAEAAIARLTDLGAARMPADKRRELEAAKAGLKEAREPEAAARLKEAVAWLEALLLEHLSEGERRELEAARLEAARAHEMLAVPDDAIQVDVFTSDPRTGSFAKTHFYTKAEAPDHLDQAKMREAEQQAGLQGPGGRPLAPFAVDHIRNTLLAERTQQAMKAEAEADAGGSSSGSGSSS